jgi:endonuclease III
VELLNEAEIVELFERFTKNNPLPKAELNYYSPYTLLVAVVLSAQTTDKSVNKVTEELFKKADSPEKMCNLTQEEIAAFIRPIGLTNCKSKNILSLSKTLIEKFNSTVPSTREELMTLSGVGRKTANVVLNVAFGKKVMPVDTHILRVSPKIGLAQGKTPLEVEESLCKRIPDKYMLNAHHYLLLHGRYVCRAKKTDCEHCIINDLCRHNTV